MVTIVQDYGPFYGEPVNGTVQGRPNGSVYVPTSNTINLALYDDSQKLSLIAGDIYRCFVNVTAQSQDLASYVRVSIYEDDELTTLFGTPRSFSAGAFNNTWGNISTGDVTPTTDETYYLVAELMNNGVAVATSNVVEVLGA